LDRAFWREVDVGQKKAGKKSESAEIVEDNNYVRGNCGAAL
jgi:hypothetical protein